MTIWRRRLSLTKAEVRWGVFRFKVDGSLNLLPGLGLFENISSCSNIASSLKFQLSVCSEFNHLFMKSVYCVGTFIRVVQNYNIEQKIVKIIVFVEKIVYIELMVNERRCNRYTSWTTLLYYHIILYIKLCSRIFRFQIIFWNSFKWY